MLGRLLRDLGFIEGGGIWARREGFLRCVLFVAGRWRGRLGGGRGFARCGMRCRGKTAVRAIGTRLLLALWGARVRGRAAVLACMPLVLEIRNYSQERGHADVVAKIFTLHFPARSERGPHREGDTER